MPPAADDDDVLSYISFFLQNSKLILKDGINLTS